MLRPFVHPVACCYVLLEVLAQSLKPVKLFSQQLPTFLLFRDRRSVAQQCWIRLHSSSNIVGATQGCVLPTMHCRFQHCWELLHPFAHYCQHGRNNSQHCWRNNVGSCWQLLRPFARSLTQQNSWGRGWGEFSSSRRGHVSMWSLDMYYPGPRGPFSKYLR